MKRTCHRQSGLTLLELLLATALTAMLLVAVAGVIGQLGAAAFRTGRSPGTAPPSERRSAKQLTSETVDAAVRLLRSDLRQARQARIDNQRLTITGPCALEAHRRGRVHRPVQVTYAIETIDGTSWLVRYQQARDVSISDNRQLELVCAGIERFAVERENGLVLSQPTTTNRSQHPPDDKQGGDTSGAAAFDPQTVPYSQLLQLTQAQRRARAGNRELWNDRYRWVRRLVEESDQARWKLLDLESFEIIERSDLGQDPNTRSQRADNANERDTPPTDKNTRTSKASQASDNAGRNTEGTASSARVQRVEYRLRLWRDAEKPAAHARVITTIPRASQ